MCLIFAASADRRSWEHSSRYVAPVIRWLFPAASEATVDEVVFAVRKCAHASEYAVLAVLVWWAVAQRIGASTVLRDRRAVAITLAIVVLYAVTDEVHQSFVPTRQGSALDVLVDTTGAVLGLLFLRCLARWRQRRSNSGGQ